MLELIKNIGLGLFVNGSFALMNFNFKPQSFIITAFSVGIGDMYLYAKEAKDE